MPIKPISLGTRSNPGRHSAAGAARLINCYAEEAGAEGKLQWPVYASDGLTSFATLSGGGPIRAMLDMNGLLYVVCGRVIHVVDPSGGSTAIGGVASDGHVTMARNRRQPNPQLCITCDGLSQIVEAAMPDQITDPDLPPAIAVTAMDGYFIFAHADGRFTISGIDDGGVIDPADFASAESDPDGLVTVARRGREVVLFGNASLELWQNTGADPFPFSRASTVDIGCLAGGSVAAIEQTVAFAASDGTVRVLDGYTPRRISSHAVERAIDAASDKTALQATSWERRGHSFYVLSGSDFTWQYNLTTGAWIERKSYLRDRWRVGTIATLNGRLIAGSGIDGKLYEMSPDAYDEAGEPLILTVQTPLVHAYPERLTFNALYLDPVPGVGLNTTAAHNADPQIMVDWSDDNGVSWSAERMVSVGGIGASTKRVVLRRLGHSREDGRTFRISMSADVVKGLTGAAVDAERLAA